MYHNDTYIFFFFLFSLNASLFLSVSLSLPVSLALALVSAFLIPLSSFLAGSMGWHRGERSGSATTRGSTGDT